MANTDIINKSSDIQSYVPSETQKLLKDLEKDLKTSMSTDTNFQRVRDQLKDLRSKYPDLVGDLDAIEVYLRSLEYQKMKEKNALFAESKKSFSTLSSRHGRSVSLGEESTAGSVGVSIPDTTNASVDAAGKPTQEYGSTIVHGDGYFDRADVRTQIQRGRELLAGMPLEQINNVKQNTETLVSPSLGSITVPKFENQLYRDMITKNDYVPYVVGILAPSQFDPDRISVHVGSPTSIILYDMEGKPTGTIAQFDANSTVELLNKPKQFANGYWGVPTKDGRNYVLLASIDNLRDLIDNEVSNIGNTDPQKVGKETTKEAAGVKEIEQTLKEINPETLDKAVTLSEQFINLVPDAQTKATLQGIHGAMILNMLRQAGHNLMIQNGKVTIEPKPGVSVVELQTKLQTLVNTGRLSIDTFKIGLLYSSPIFKKYATELGVTKDAQGNIVGIDPKANSKTFLEHVAELKKTGQNSPDITSLLASASMLESVDFKQAMKGFQDLGQIEGFDKQNPGLLAAVASGTNVSTSTPNAPLAGGAANSTTWTGKLVGGLNSYGVNGAPVSNFVSDSFKGFGRGFNDLVSLGKGDPIATLAIGGALIYGIWRMFNVGGKFGFFKGLGMIFGLGVLNNLGKISGDDVKETAKSVKDTVGELYDAAKNKVTGATGATATPAESSEKPVDVTEDQKYLRDALMQNASVIASVNRVSQNAEKNKKLEIGKMEHYLQFIETDLKDKPLNQLFPQDHKESIFGDTHKTSFSVPPNLNAKILKEVIRAYLGGDNMDRLFGTGDTRGVSDKENFLKTYSITAEDIKNKKLSDILAQVHQKRSSAGTQSSPTQPTTSQPQSSPANDVPIAASAKLIVDGKNISSGDQLKMKLKAQVFDEQGNNSQIDRLPKDSKGNAYLDQDRVVIVTGKVITVKGITLAEATYAGQQIYVSPQHLKGIAS